MQNHESTTGIFSPSLLICLFLLIVLETGKFTDVVGYAVQDALQETDIGRQLEQLAVEKTAIAKRLEQLAAELVVVKQMLEEQRVQPVVVPAPEVHDDNEEAEGVVGPVTNQPEGGD